MKWLEALKLWNAEKKKADQSHKYKIPKKGTPEYDEIKALMKSS